MPLIQCGSKSSADTRHDIGEQWTGRAATGCAAQLFMIKSNDHLIRIVFPRVDHGNEARMQAAQVVQPRRGEELPMRPKDHRTCCVVHPKVVAINVDSRAPSDFGYMIKNMNTRMANTPDRGGVELLVQLEAIIVHAAIKMDSQLRYSHDRLGTHQLCAPVTQHQATCQTELAIQPRIEQRSAVDLHTELLPAMSAYVRPRLEHETRRIRMRAKDPERQQGARALRDPPSDQCAVPYHVMTARFRAPLR